MRRLSISLTCLALFACGEKPSGEAAPALQVQQDMAAAAKPAAEGVKVQLPQIAYSYRYGFSVSGDRMAALQDAHLALCDRAGLARCRMIETQRSRSDDGETTGSLKLQVEAGLARTFGAQLSGVAKQQGGNLVDSSTTSEDLSKQIVDTEARLRSKEVLVARLTQLLQARNGTVAELVEAERKTAEAQEEIDAARSWLAEMRGRVSMSAVAIDYNSRSGSDVLRPIGNAFGQLGDMLGSSIAALILFIAAALPWALALILIGWAIRRLLRLRRARRTAHAAPPQ